jgi:hypothetical protein
MGLTKQVGGTKTAAAFRLSRASLYRIVWRQEPKGAQPPKTVETDL